MLRVHERAVHTVPRVAHLLLSSLPNVNPPLLSPHPFQIYVNDTLITNIPDELAGMHSLQVRQWLLLRVVTVLFLIRGSCVAAAGAEPGGDQRRPLEGAAAEDIGQEGYVCVT